MKMINLTPHDLNIMGENGQFIKIPRTPHPTLENRFIILRAESKKEKINVVNGIEIFQTTYGELTLCHVDAQGKDPVEMSLDELIVEMEDIVITSFIAKQAYFYNMRIFINNIMCPGEAIRDDSGQIIGAMGLTV